MGTKNHPGRHDCYAAAEPDEPMFILLGRDPVAWLLVLLWVRARTALGTDREKLDEAVFCAGMLAGWAVRKGKDLAPARVAVEDGILAWAEEIRADRAARAEGTVARGE